VPGWIVRFLMGTGLLFRGCARDMDQHHQQCEATRGRVLSFIWLRAVRGYGCGPIVLRHIPIEVVSSFVVALRHWC
jgi:hypothetical protein